MSDNREDDKIGPAIGIDLGTWKCCVGVVRNGKVEIIENERGSKTTPSYVAFTEMERIIGEDAKRQVALNPSNTVYGVKRIIGRKFDDPSVQDIKDTFPFTVKPGNSGTPLIEVSYKGNMECLYPEQVTAMLLTKMKRVAESHLGCKVRDAVISVPAYFNNAQRQATKDAGAIAGLNVLGLINEPTAAALAYRDNKGPTDETICVVDLGGGTLDVSVIRMEGDEGITVLKTQGITVLKTQGDTSLGGLDFDQRLVRHFEKEFSNTSNHNISGNKKASERLRLACEKLKHTLSLLPTGRIQLDCLAKDTDLESSISRDTFDELCHEDFEQSLYSVLTKTLLSSKQEPDDFNRVVLVGGSTRIPYVQELLRNVLGKGLDKSVNPDEAVAHGAAIRAALLGKEPSLPDVAVREVSGHTFEMESEYGRDIVFCQDSHQTVRKYDITNLEEFNSRYNIYESLFDVESKGAVSRRIIGSVKLSDLAEPLPSELLFRVDRGVFGGEMRIGKKRYPFISNDCLNTEEQLTLMYKQEEEFRADEENEKRRLVALSDLEAYCFLNKPIIEELSSHNRESEDLKHKFINLCDAAIDWLDCNPEATEGDCKEKTAELVKTYSCVIPPSPPNDAVNIRNDSVAPCTEPTIAPNAGVTKVRRMTSGAGWETNTNRAVGDHPLRNTSPVKPEHERVPPKPNTSLGKQNSDAARDDFNVAHDVRAGTSTAFKRPHDGFGTGRNTAARAEIRRLRDAVPVHGNTKGLHRHGNYPFPNYNTQYSSDPRQALRNDRVGTSSGTDTQIQMNRRGSVSSFDSSRYLNDSERRSPDKSFLQWTWNGIKWVGKMFWRSPKDKARSQSKRRQKQ